MGSVLSIRDRLYDASYMGDVKLVEALLLEDPEILHSRPPVKIDGLDRMNRTALLMCGFDPQTDNITALDYDCAEIAALLANAGANLSHIDSKGWNGVIMGAVRGLKNFVGIYLLK